MEQFNKRDKLEEVLNAPDRNPVDRALVFVQTKKNADFVTANLCQNGFEAVSIHGDRFLSQRFEALENFKSGTKPVLVATAVAARGLDINGVELVINYDLPREIEEYVHRIGKSSHSNSILIYLMMSFRSDWTSWKSRQSHLLCGCCREC